MMPIILASQSPRRKQLLEWAEIPFRIVLQATDETFPAGLQPTEAAVHIARQKALAVKAMVQTNELILAADTIVVLDSRIIGKPANREEAIHTLTQLAGNEHQVITGVVMLQEERETSFADVTTVKFHSLTNEQITFYVDKYQPYDKAGAYAIQEWIGVVGIQSVQGDFYNVMGLPVSRVVQEIHRMRPIETE